MFEARMASAKVFKGAVDAIKDLVNDANFDCSQAGMQMQAMDSNHVSLVALLLRADGFAEYRCDRNVSLGINLESLTKVMRCAGGDDAMTVRASDQGDTATFLFDSPKKSRSSDFELKLMDIDAEHLDIPETEYQCVVQMPSDEFQRICRDMAVMGDTITIKANKQGVNFNVKGDTGTGNITLNQSGGADSKDGEQVIINLEEAVTQTFALRYLSLFTKATSLSPTVTLSMSANVPLAVEYKMGDLGYIRFYLAPKIEE